MIAAIGYNTSTFFPDNPDRLCRGRERWIDSQLLETIENEPLHRVVISGACFQDDSARNALRGIRCADISHGDLLRSLFVTADIVGWAEDADPTKIPGSATGVELAQRNVPFGSVGTWFARYELVCDSAEKIETAVTAGVDVFLINPKLREDEETFTNFSELPPLHGEQSLPPVLSDDLRNKLFYLTGSRTGYRSFCRFQAAALPDLLEDCDCVVLLHHDKHDYCFGLYTKNSLQMDELVQSIEERLGLIVVPFSIPPMLARWDRAIWELRRRWDSDKNGSFPIPPSDKDHKTDENPDEDSVEVVAEEATTEDPSIEENDPFLQEGSVEVVAEAATTEDPSVEESVQHLKDDVASVASPTVSQPSEDITSSDE